MEKIIQILDDMISHDYWWNYNWQHNCLEEAKERIIAVWDLWISVDDLIPIKWETVLRFNSVFPNEITIAVYNDNWFSSNYWSLNTTHWMKLPKTPSKI